MLAVRPLQIVLHGVIVERFDEATRIGATPTGWNIGTGPTDFGERRGGFTRGQSLHARFVHPVTVDGRVSDGNPELRKTVAELIHHRSIYDVGVPELRGRSVFVDEARVGIGQGKAVAGATIGVGLAAMAAAEQYEEAAAVRVVEVHFVGGVVVVETGGQRTQVIVLHRSIDGRGQVDFEKLRTGV